VRQEEGTGYSVREGGGDWLVRETGGGDWLVRETGGGDLSCT